MSPRKGIYLRPQVTLKETVAEYIYSCGVINTDTLTPAHGGGVIPAYMEFDHLWANPKARNSAVSLLIGLLICNVPAIPEYKLVSVPCGANGFTFGVALRQDLSMAFVERADKEHGSPHRIRGAVKGDRVVILDDVVKFGTSVIRVADACKSEGIIVTDVVAFVDREQGGYERLQRRGYGVHTAYTISQVLDYGVKFEKITRNDRQKLGEKLAALPRANPTSTAAS